VRISSVPANGDVGRIIGEQLCQQATDPAFREIGSWRRGTDVGWLSPRPSARRRRTSAPRSAAAHSH